MTSGPTPAAVPPPADADDLQRRLAQFRHEFHVLGNVRAREDLERLVALASELHLREDSIREELAEIRASFDGLELVDRITREGLPILSISDSLTHDVKHFEAPVRFGRRRSDQFGRLELYGTHLRFQGALDVSVAWSEASEVRRDEREIIVSLNDSRRLLRFWCASRTEAAHGCVIAGHLAHRLGTAPIQAT
jgi:hypothetical protein